MFFCARQLLGPNATLDELKQAVRNRVSRFRSGEELTIKMKERLVQEVVQLRLHIEELQVRETEREKEREREKDTLRETLRNRHPARKVKSFSDTNSSERERNRALNDIAIIAGRRYGDSFKRGIDAQVRNSEISISIAIRVSPGRGSRMQLQLP